MRELCSQWQILLEIARDLSLLMRELLTRVLIAMNNHVGDNVHMYGISNMQWPGNLKCRFLVRTVIKSSDKVGVEKPRC
jgi:hypothetical protein